MFSKTKAKIEDNVIAPVRHAYLFAIAALLVAFAALLASVRYAH